MNEFRELDAVKSLDIEEENSNGEKMMVMVVM